MQQRYQFILKGTGPLLKEWDIVLSIYDNEKLIVKLKEQQNRLDNSSLDNEIESLPKPKDSEELENQLVEYRAQLQSQPTQDFINKPPLDEEGNPMNYDSDIAKGNTDRDFDEMNPFADQELDNIQKEINNMEDLEGLDELQKKFEERTPTLPDTNISDIPSGISETVLLQNNSSDNEENVEKKIKFNNDILHQSKLMNYFNGDYVKSKIEKDLNSYFKKIKKNKKYLISKKEIILIESLKSDGIKISKKYEGLYEINDSEMPTDIQVMINNNEMGAALLRIVEVIGQDKLDRIDEDTMYFIIFTLNQLDIDVIRNKILLKVLPLKV